MEFAAFEHAFNPESSVCSVLLSVHFTLAILPLFLQAQNSNRNKVISLNKDSFILTKTISV